MKKISLFTSFVWITTWLESLGLCLVLPAQMWTSLHCVFFNLSLNDAGSSLCQPVLSTRPLLLLRIQKIWRWN